MDLKAEVTMNKKQSPQKRERRNFTALTSVSAGLLTESSPTEKRANTKTRSSKGYHETPHIQAYYQSLRN
jgi:hypothetical protein